MRYLLLLLTLLIGKIGFSQTSDTFNLDWYETSITSPDGEIIKTISFNGASLDLNNNWLPEFYNLQRTGSNGEIFSVELLDTQFKQLSSIEQQILRNKSLSSVIEAKVESVTIRKTQYQKVQFVPIRKNPANGSLEKLISFTLRFKKIGQGSSVKSAKNYASNSVLSTGNWVKVAVDTTAIHKITYSDLIDMGITNPANVRVYGYGGMLPKMNSDNSIDDLPVVPVYFHLGEDGIFNSGDYLLFYANGPRSWTFNPSTSEFIHENHLYSKQSFYFLSSDMGNPQLVQNQNSEASYTNTVNTFNDYRVIDIDETNLLESGRLWFGQEYDVDTEFNYTFNFPNVNTASNSIVSLSFAARSSSATTLHVNSGSTSIGDLNIAAVNTGSYTATYASLKQQSFTNFSPSSDDLQIQLDYQKSSASSVGWLDYLRVNTRRNLVFSGSQMAFRDAESVGAGNISRFQVQNCNSSTLVWDVSNQNSVQQIPLSLSGSTGSFNVSTNSLKEFIVFDPEANFPTPVVIGNVSNQNLHALPQTDMLIVSNGQFLSYAEQIADFHRNKDGMSVIVVNQDVIFNEFSSGTPDVSAIRNFVKMFYDRASGEADMIKYLLLFGDGSFDNISDRESNTNKILTYQSENSLSPTQSFVTDDFYGLLDNDEGEASGLVDIGIGRLPVNTSEEAQIAVNKIINYNSAEKGDWQSMLCFIGDDEDNNTHMRDANRLAVKVESAYPQYQVQRIFLDDFEQITTSAGQEYPDVNTEINESVNKGTLLMNYTGHGNENGLAHEHILMTDDIYSWQNPVKLPLFMTATCEFSRFDNYKKLSAGEIIFLRENGGGIGLFTTTRLVFSSPNFTLNQNFYDFAFERGTDGNYYRLGDIMRMTKNATSSGINKRNFTLLGDPALQLNYPEHNAISTHVNDVSISQPIDTLKALSEVKVSGKIVTGSGSDISNFNGTIYPTVYDKATAKTTRGNDGNQFEYTSQTSILYKGKASIKNGNFEFSFFVPKDINYQYGNGKISYYASGANTDAAGYTNSIIVGGTNPNASDDKIGPEIELYMNDEQFTPGGMTNENPLLLAIVQDSSGINTVGNAIGHDLVAILDQKTDAPIELNDFYESDLDNYKKGKVSYQLSELETGEHEIQLKVWDNVNNSSVATLDFVVAETADLVIKHVLNYPNPFTTNTGFYFEHNQASSELDVLIQILTVSGKLIKTIETTINSSGNRVGPIQWDGKDDFGNSIGRGVYFYRVKVRADNGKTVNKFQKLVILK
ncbi:type IX secretion system sortase PorU [Marinifilum caeruleilacunae]|uniref:Type IX secretion system sortase PorU n=1 Tax=Marinifilum caeruleilacunae TaxID=2499076 RepID=A0ABX1WW43_9BACT|nr:type IX secretion system sortase PorU [Marinifilum caeruleilacunae]NOU60277.1 type IX secretion system sortase PorU [Marinifilum caeruleilacunae]